MNLEHIFLIKKEAYLCLINLNTMREFDVSFNEFRDIMDGVKNNLNIKTQRFNDFVKFVNPINNNVRIKTEDTIINPVIITSYDCNYNCTYCYQKKHKYIKSKMNSSDLKRIDNFYNKLCDYYGIEKKYGTISIMGGEPLLLENKELVNNMFNFWDSKFLITTNGTYLEEYADILLDKKVELHISLDGIKESHYKDRITKDVFAYEKTIRGIKWAVENGKDVTVMTVFQPENLNEYSLFFDLLESLGWLKKENLKVHFSLKVRSGCDNIEQDYLLQSIKAFVKLKEIDKRTNSVEAFRMIPNSFSFLENLHLSTYENCYDIYRCSSINAPNYTFTPDGEVHLCGLTRNDKLKIGLFREELFIDYELINKIRRRNIINMKSCEKCYHKFICKGGCIASAVEKYNDISHPFCSAWKEGELYNYMEEVFRNV